MLVIIVILVVGILFILYNIFHDKICFLDIKLDSVEEKINSTLIKRKELLKEAEKIIKDKLKTDKEIFQGFNELNTNMNIVKLDRKLLVYVSEFHLIKEKYDKLNDDENFEKIAFSINETEDLLNAYKDYYNNYASKYNKAIKSFPIILFNLIKRRKEKPFFDNKSMNDSDFDEFKY